MLILIISGLLSVVQIHSVRTTLRKFVSKTQHFFFHDFELLSKVMTPVLRASVLCVCIIFQCVFVPAIVDAIVMGDSKVTFENAIAYCDWLGGDLLSIHSNVTQEAAANVCNYTDNVVGGCWIGIHREPNVSDVWIWTGGSDTDYGFTFNGATQGAYPWNEGEPNDHTGTEDCVHLQPLQNYRWNDNDCMGAKYPLCGMQYVNCISAPVVETSYSNQDYQPPLQHWSQPLIQRQIQRLTLR